MECVGVIGIVESKNVTVLPVSMPCPSPNSSLQSAFLQLLFSEHKYYLCILYKQA